MNSISKSPGHTGSGSEFRLVGRGRRTPPLWAAPFPVTRSTFSGVGGDSFDVPAELLDDLDESRVAAIDVVDVVHLGHPPVRTQTGEDEAGPGPDVVRHTGALDSSSTPPRTTAW